MKTPYLEEKINDLEILNSANELSTNGKDALIEFKAIKQALNIQNVSKCTICELEINYKGVCESCYTKEGTTAC